MVKWQRSVHYLFKNVSIIFPLLALYESLALYSTSYYATSLGKGLGKRWLRPIKFVCFPIGGIQMLLWSAEIVHCVFQ